METGFPPGPWRCRESTTLLGGKGSFRGLSILSLRRHCLAFHSCSQMGAVCLVQALTFTFYKCKNSNPCFFLRAGLLLHGKVQLSNNTWAAYGGLGGCSHMGEKYRQIDAEQSAVAESRWPLCRADAGVSEGHGASSMGPKL